MNPKMHVGWNKQIVKTYQVLVFVGQEAEGDNRETEGHSKRGTPKQPVGISWKVSNDNLRSSAETGRGFAQFKSRWA